MNMMHKNQKGFTIVELLLAMAAFSFVMVIIVVAFTQIIQTYRAGVTAQKTQEANRQIITRITREAHSASNLQLFEDTSNGVVALCFNDVQYRFANNNIQYTQGGINNDCSFVPSPGSNTQNLVEDELIVSAFEPRIATSATGIQLGIDLRLVTATNTDDLLTDDRTACDPTLSGSQFCSTAQTITSIGLRGNK